MSPRYEYSRTHTAPAFSARFVCSDKPFGDNAGQRLLFVLRRSLEALIKFDQSFLFVWLLLFRDRKMPFSGQKKEATVVALVRRVSSAHGVMGYHLIYPTVWLNSSDGVSSDLPCSLAER